MTEQIPDIKTIEDLLDRGTYLELKHEVNKISCQERESVDLPPFKSTPWYPGKDQVKSIIQNHFRNENPLPLAIDYCSKILFAEPSYVGIFSKLDDLNSFLPDCGAHSSILMGYQVNDQGEEEVLVKNSVGSRGRYSASWKSEGGKIWVLLDSIANNTFRIHYWELTD